VAQEIRPITADFDGADFGDRRLAARLTWLGEALAARPDQALPDALLTEAGLEAGYRFLNNERVTPAGILAPHIELTVARSRRAERVLVLHDTTTFHFNGRGFGPLRGATLGEGFFGHVALAVDGIAERAPLGVVGLRTFERQERPRGRRKTHSERRDDNEMRHWAELFGEVQEVLGDTRAVHVMDRQADSYVLFSTMFGNADFVVRATHDRIANSDGDRVRDVLAQQPVVLERTVSITARAGTGLNRDRHQPARDERTAVLHVTAAAIDLPRPCDSKGTPRATTPAAIPLKLVRVYEADPPDGEQPIEWLLWTTLPIDTSDQVEEIVDTYRARWVIEELFKAIKTGCAYEQRRLESAHGLLNMLALTIPVACRLLLLRHLARHAPDAPASRALPRSQLAVLAATPRAALPKRPTIQDAFCAIARLGGHLRRNGSPGWQVLTRGYHELLVLEEGWLAARGRAEM
jgi:hypothetical protein